MEVELLKCHGSGNEFYLIDEIKHSYDFLEEDRVILARLLSNQHGTEGADGVLFLLPSNIAHGRMRIFNSDGSEAEMCGNGLRCIGRYLMEALKEERVTIETMKASYLVKHAEDIYKGVYTVEILIDTIDFEVGSVPIIYPQKTLLFKKLEELSREYSFSAVSITNPHLVALVDSIDEEKLMAIGLRANINKQLLPTGANVNFVRIINHDCIFVRTYERGVGLTPSCGTGITASSVIVAMTNEKIIGKPLKVINEGGMIICIVNKDVKENFSVSFIGNASYMADLTIEYKQGSFHIIGNKEYYSLEEKSYDEFRLYVKEKMMS